MNIKIVKLKFLAPVHFGDGRLEDGLLTCAADTLFSALFIEALRLDVQNSLLIAVRDANLLISDTFPYISETLYLPKPYFSVTNDDASEDDRTASIKKKSFKKLKYIPASRYNDYFAGTIDPQAENKSFNLGVAGGQTKVNLTRENRDEAEPFHVGSYSFDDSGGLYFIVSGSYDVESLLNSLQYSGIGGKRSSGYGRFEYEVTESSTMTNLFSKTGNNKILLSSAMPAENELDETLLQEASYLLKRRSGFVQSGTYAETFTKKRDFYTFIAGSVFKKRFDGDVFDVNAGGKHPVYRYAKALWIEV